MTLVVFTLEAVEGQDFGTKKQGALFIQKAASRPP